MIDVSGTMQAVKLSMSVVTASMCAVVASVRTVAEYMLAVQ